MLKKKPIPYGGGFDPDHMLSEIQVLEAKTLEPGFWDDRKGAEQLFAELNGLKDSYYPWKELMDSISEMSELLEIYADEPENPEEEAQIDEQIKELKEQYSQLKLKTLLDGKFDKNDCFLTIHAGAGGNEACACIFGTVNATDSRARYSTCWRMRAALKVQPSRYPVLIVSVT